MIAEGRVELVHQPIPVSPRAPSTIGGLGVPVVMGPLNGGMDFPPAFRGYDGAALRFVYGLGRRLSGLGHLVADGKLRADALLVANPRTAQALPKGVRGEVIELVENGVDPSLWGVGGDRPEASTTGPARFVFLGRLVDWKAVDLLLEAFSRVVAEAPALLEIVGDGAMRASLEDQARRLGLSGGTVARRPSSSRDGSRSRSARNDWPGPMPWSCRASTSAAGRWSWRRWPPAAR